MRVHRYYADGKLIQYTVNGIDQPLTEEMQRPNTKTEWPIWAKALKQFSTPDDKGIGDVVARMIGDENSMKFKAWHLATFGRPCDCTSRRERWNKQYPL